MLIYDDNRPENIRSVIGWTVFLLMVGYVAMNVVVPNNDMNIAIDALIAVMGFMALCFYIGRATVAIWTGSRLNTDYLIVGIALSWLSQDGQAVLRIIARLSNFDPAWVNSEFFGPTKLLSVIAAVLHVIPKGAADGVVPRGSRFVVAGFFGLAAIIAITLLTIKPDPRPVIERLPGWSRDFFQTGELPPGASPPV